MRCLTNRPFIPNLVFPSPSRGKVGIGAQFLQGAASTQISFSRHEKKKKGKIMRCMMDAGQGRILGLSNNEPKTNQERRAEIGKKIGVGRFQCRVRKHGHYIRKFAEKASTRRSGAR